MTFFLVCLYVLILSLLDFPMRLNKQRTRGSFQYLHQRNIFRAYMSLVDLNTPKNGASTTREKKRVFSSFIVKHFFFLQCGRRWRIYKMRIYVLCLFFIFILKSLNIHLPAAMMQKVVPFSNQTTRHIYLINIFSVSICRKLCRCSSFSERHETQWDWDLRRLEIKWRKSQFGGYRIK